MDIKLDWEKTLFVNRFTFFVKNKEVGRYSYGLFKDNAKGQLLNINLRFKKSGWFNSRTDIINSDDESKVGTIIMKSGLIRNKATIVVRDTFYEWESTSFWSGKWHLKDADRVRVKGNNNKLRGTFKVTDADVPLILSSMYISRNFKDSNKLFTIIIASPPVINFLFRLTG